MLPLAFTYGLTATGVFYGLVRPYYGLLVYIALSTIRPMGLWPTDVPPGPYSQLVAIATLIGWFMCGFGDVRLGAGKPLALLLLAFWAWTGVSASAALDSAVAWESVLELSKIFLPIAIGFTLIRTTADLRKLAWTMVLSQSIIALAGHVTVYLGSGRNWLNTSGMAGFDNNDLAAGMVSMAGVAFALGLAEENPRLRWFAFFCSGLIGHAILMSQSRGGMLGFCLTGVLTVVLLWKEKHHRKFIWLALIAGLLLAGPSIRGRFMTIFEKGRDEVADRSADTRLDLWGIAWQIALENPVTGIGPDNYLPHSHQWFHRRKVIHSLWFQTACELGFVGVSLLIGLYGSSCWYAWQLIRRPPPVPFLRHAGRMVLLSLPGFCFSASFLSIIYMEQPYYLVLLTVGALKLATQGEPAFSSAAEGQRSRHANRRPGGQTPRSRLVRPVVRSGPPSAPFHPGFGS